MPIFLLPILSFFMWLGQAFGGYIINPANPGQIVNVGTGQIVQNSTHAVTSSARP